MQLSSTNWARKLFSWYYSQAIKAYVSGQIIVRISHAWLMAHLEQIFQLSTNKLQPNCCMPEISIALTTLARKLRYFARMLHSCYIVIDYGSTYKSSIFWRNYWQMSYYKWDPRLASISFTMNLFAIITMNDECFQTLLNYLLIGFLLLSPCRKYSHCFRSPLVYF